MSYFCSQHRDRLSQDPEYTLSTWRTLIENGSEQHREGNYRQSSEHFAAALEVAGIGLSQQPCPALINMRVIAGHNFSAALSAAGDTHNAESVLLALHREISKLCADCKQQRCIRLEALSQLKTTLFSLVSQLGLMGKADSLHATINETEYLAETTAQQLFH